MLTSTNNAPGMEPAYWRVVVQTHRLPLSVCAICERVFQPALTHYVLNAEGQAVVCVDCGRKCEDETPWGGECDGLNGRFVSEV